MHGKMLFLEANIEEHSVNLDAWLRFCVCKWDPKLLVQYTEYSVINKQMKIPIKPKNKPQ